MVVDAVRENEAVLQLLNDPKKNKYNMIITVEMKKKGILLKVKDM